MKTYSAKKGDFVKKWVIIDAADQSLGRVASKAAQIIRGKTKPIFTPHVDTGDNVIIINAAKVRLTGKKWDDKIYYHHTGYPGGIKSTTIPCVMIVYFVIPFFSMRPSKQRLSKTPANAQHFQ